MKCSADGGSSKAKSARRRRVCVSRLPLDALLMLPPVTSERARYPKVTRPFHRPRLQRRLSGWQLSLYIPAVCERGIAQRIRKVHRTRVLRARAPCACGREVWLSHNMGRPRKREGHRESSIHFCSNPQWNRFPHYLGTYCFGRSIRGVRRVRTTCL